MRNRQPPPPLNPPKAPSVHTLVREAEAAADIALGSAHIAKQAAEKVVDALPTPDPRDNVNFQRLAGLEQSMLARISPRHRNRWPDLLEIDERWEDCDRRQEEIRASLNDLHTRRQRAETEHADALAAWMIAGQQGSRPMSEAKALDDAIADAAAEHDAVDRLRDTILEERIAFMNKHRKRLVRDADEETQRARERYVEAIAEVERVRAELIGLRETTVWASLYPSDTLRSFAPSHALAGGGRRASERRGFQTAVPAPAVFDLLRDDAEHLTTVATAEQAAAIDGVSRAALMGDEAMWAGSDEDRERQKREKQRLIEMYERTWGRKPDEFR